MPEYQVLARKYRPQTFAEVIGQEAIVATLKNAIKHGRLAHAYLFCGSRGTGKTTLARVLAKALNCLQPGENFEPCSSCSFCKEIATGSSLDVLEIDGASHRGIDDIRQINETVGYAASSGKYKIYIIDEVHMLTKEAFNALLKTLEEPPPKVKFLFATTEPHKVLPTILSRCQRFNLNRIPLEAIIAKLTQICQDMEVNIEKGAVRLVASRADGGLRDAESLLDQIIAFQDGLITTADVANILGVMPRDSYFEIDRAGKEGNLAVAFEVANRVFSEGKDLVHFVEGLTEHFRNILHVKLAGREATFLSVSEEEREQYLQTATLYTQEQCLTILDYLIEAQSQIRFMPSGRFALEAILLHILRIHQRVPIDVLVRKLGELEKHIKEASQTLTLPPQPTPTAVLPKQEVPPPQPTPQSIAATPPPPPPKPKPKPNVTPSIQEDPTPSPADLPTKPPSKKKAPTIVPDMSKQSHYDTVMQFATVELEGKLEKKPIKIN